VDKSHTACCNNVQDYTNIQDAIIYPQATAYSPAKTTLVQAINNVNFASWPGMTWDNVNKQYEHTNSTAKGNMAQTRRNTRSTQPKPTPEKENDKTTTEDFAPTDILSQRKNEVYAIITELDGKVYTDLTRRFLTTSSEGNKYVLILYTYDGNAILVEPKKSRTEKETVGEYTVLYKQLTNAGLQPKFEMMDNKASKAVKEFLRKEAIQYQLVPPHIHRRNAAERTIRTFKAHFIAGLSTVDAHFPMRLWCQLLHQATLTLNLLRNSRLNKKLSAYAQVFGPFDFNTSPLEPPGQRIVAHEKPKHQNSVQHGQPVESPDGTLYQPWNITDVTRYT
jgi:hypothetical protein